MTEPAMLHPLRPGDMVEIPRPYGKVPFGEHKVSMVYFRWTGTKADPWFRVEGYFEDLPMKVLGEKK